MLAPFLIGGSRSAQTSAADGARPFLDPGDPLDEFLEHHP